MGDGASEEPVSEEGESVMDEVNNNGNKVTPGGLLGGLCLVVVIDISSLDIKEADQFSSGLLESNTSTPGTDGGDETGEHVVEGISVGSGASEGLVHLPGDGERSPDDVGGETDVHEYPEHLDNTEGISSPRVTSVGEEVGSNTDGLGSEVNLDGSLDGVDGSIDTSKDTGDDGNTTSGGSVKDWESILEYVIGSDGTEEGEDSRPSSDESRGQVPAGPGSLQSSEPGGEITPGHARVEYASILSLGSSDVLGALAVLGNSDTVGGDTLLD